MSPARRVHRARAFTLIELLTVIAVVAILAAISFGAIAGVRNRAAIARARADLALIAQALEDYRRLYGDYPRTGDAVQASPNPASQSLNANHAQVLLFNALTGVYGPTRFGPVGRINGRAFLDPGKLSLEIRAGATAALTSSFQTAFQDDPAQPPVKHDELTCLLDPWGGRYQYYYRGLAANSPWIAPGFLLYSAGPDRAHTAPPRNGQLSTTTLSDLLNADNIYFGR